MGRCCLGDRVPLKYGFNTVCRFYTMLRELLGNVLVLCWFSKTIITLLVGVVAFYTMEIPNYFTQAVLS